MSRPKPLLQPTLFSLDNPPVKPVTVEVEISTPAVIETPPAPISEQPSTQEISQEEREACIVLWGQPNGERTCPHCGWLYMVATYHKDRCPVDWATGLKKEYSPPARPPEPQTTTQSGSPDGLKQQEQEPVPRSPHYHRWIRYEKGTKTGTPYTPSLEARRRDIPSIACRLWYQAKTSYLWMELVSRSAPEYYPQNREGYEGIQRLVEKSIQLLVFCGLDEEPTRAWAREAWKRAKENYVPWLEWPDKRDRPGEGRELLRLLGYEPHEKEGDGWLEEKLDAAVDQLVSEPQGRPLR